MTSEASGSPAWDWWPSAHWGTGRWRGAGRLRPGLEGTRPHSPESSAGVGYTCRSPAILMPPILQHHLAGPRSVVRRLYTLPARPPSLDPRLSTSCCCDQEHPAHVGSPGLSAAQRVDGDPHVRARGTRQARDWLFSPQRMGSLAHRAASDFVHPKRPLRVRAVSVCVQTSECGLSEKHAFWHKTRDITHFILFEALLSP